MNNAPLWLIAAALWGLVAKDADVQWPSILMVIACIGVGLVEFFK